MEKYIKYIKTPIGILKLESEEHFITNVINVDKVGNEKSGVCKILMEVEKQLNEYFQGSRKTFQIPLKLDGTDFQKRVWNALCNIPYGEVKSYKQIAEEVGSPKAMRAVGMANHNNPVMIIVPCHRVIGANGSLVGFGGGLPMKKALLDLECKYK